MASARTPPGPYGRPESLDAPPQSTRSTIANPAAKDSIGYLARFRSPSARMRSYQPQGIISSYQNPKLQNESGPTPGTTPATAAGLEEKPWSLEQVVDMVAEYHRTKEDDILEAAFAAKW